MHIPPIIIRILNKFRLLPYLNVKTKITTNEKVISVPVRGRLGIGFLWDQEPWMDLLLKKLKPLFNGRFIDVGVNVGQTLVKSQTIFSDFNYVGFEPNPVCQEYCKNLIKLNQFKNCAIIPAAISEKDSILELNFFSNNDGDSSASIVENFRDKNTVVKKEFVCAYSGENVIGFLPKIKHSFLKIDVEGAETEVIEGLKNWIDEYRPIIIAQVLPAYTADNTFRIERQNRIALLLSKMNYVILRMHKDTNDIKVTRHEDFGIISEIKLSDYIFYPREIESEISQLFKFG